MLQETNNPVPSELASHPAALTNPKEGPAQKSRRDTIIYATR